MDITTKDGITLRNIPDGTPDDAIKARIQQIRAGSAPAAAPQPPQAPADPPHSPMYRASKKVANGLQIILNPGPGESMMDTMEQGANYAGGKVTDVAANMGASPEVAAGLGAGTNAFLQAGPMVGGGEFAKLASPGFLSSARRLMVNALKPAKGELIAGKGERAAQTMLDEGVNVSRGGVEKLRGIGNDLNSQVDSVIANSKNATLNKYDVEDALRGTEGAFRRQVDPMADLEAIEGVGTRFLSHPDLTGKTDIPLQLAQELKQGTYKQMRDKYGELGTASTEAQKTLARALREGIEAKAPAVAPLNKRAGDTWNALDVMQGRALMEGNKDLAGLTLLNPKVAAAMQLSRSALAKSMLARALNAGHEQIPANVARILIGAGTMGNQGEQ